MDTLIPNGLPAPAFSLPDLNGAPHHLDDLRGRVGVLNFWSAECPWTSRADRELRSYLSVWGSQVTLWPIASNANEDVEFLSRTAAERGLQVVLHDAQHQVADLYGAETTPHFFVVDAQGILRYQGALDDTTFRQRTPTRSYLRQAVEAVLQGRNPDPAQTPPYGCAIVRFTPDS
jgi:peroxiredoxin